MEIEKIKAGNATWAVVTLKTLTKKKALRK
jgi:hypothetical protein